MVKNIWGKIIKEATPSIVTIVISKSLEDIEKEIPRDLLPFFPYQSSKLQIPPEAIDANGMVKVGSGSGFIVSENGIILTNKHVVADRNSEYTVITNDDKKYSVDVLARDPIDDVAILKIAANNLPGLPLGNSNKIELGQPVLAIGNALGLFKNTASSGIVSGLSRAINASANPLSPTQEMRGLIQTDAAINPGNSGGPLLDEYGKAIGINTAVVFGAQNLSFAIPINDAHRDLDDLRNFGRIKRPLLGIRYITIDDDIKERLKLSSNYGALVIGQSLNQGAIITDSPADKAGLKEKDILLECNGEKITKEQTLLDLLDNKSVGDYVLLKVRRGRRDFEIKTMLMERK